VVPPTDKPWTATARIAVLYDAGGEWRYAIYGDLGVADGVLDGPARGATPEQAQAALLDRVADVTGRRYSAVWTAHESRRWTGDLSVVDP
jgi:hypothetical protein